MAALTKAPARFENRPTAAGWHLCLSSLRYSVCEEIAIWSTQFGPFCHLKEMSAVVILWFRPMRDTSIDVGRGGGLGKPRFPMKPGNEDRFLSQV